MKRSNLLLIGVVLAVLAIPAVYLLTRGNAAAPSDVTFFHYWDQDFEPIRSAIDQISHKYNSGRKKRAILHPMPLDHESFKVKMGQLDENPPDLFSYWPGGRVKALVDRNRVVPIDDLWNSRGLDKVFTGAGTRRASIYNGKHYLIPVNQFLICFLYNKAVFDRYGLKPPGTWEEFLRVCEQLKKNGITPIALGGREKWPLQWWFDYPLIRTAGPEFRRRLLETGQGYDGPECARAMGYLTALLNSGYIQKDALSGDWNDSVMDMAGQKAAMVLMGQFAIGILEKAGMKEGVDYDFFPFPRISGQVPDAVIGGMDGILLARDTEAGKDALAYFATPDAQMLINQGTCGVCPSDMVPDSYYTPMRQRMKKIFENSPDWQLSFDVSVNPETALAGLDAFYEITASRGNSGVVLKRLQTAINAETLK